MGNAPSPLLEDGAPPASLDRPTALWPLRGAASAAWRRAVASAARRSPLQDVRSRTTGRLPTFLDHARLCCPRLCWLRLSATKVTQDGVHDLLSWRPNLSIVV